jgi:hypothetical protein
MLCGTAPMMHALVLVAAFLPHCALARKCTAADVFNDTMSVVALPDDCTVLNFGGDGATNMKLGEQGAIKLAERLRQPRPAGAPVFLQQMYFWGNAIGDAGAEALSGALAVEGPTYCSNVTFLSLSGNEISDLGASLLQALRVGCGAPHSTPLV